VPKVQYRCLKWSFSSYPQPLVPYVLGRQSPDPPNHSRTSQSIAGSGSSVSTHNSWRISCMTASADPEIHMTTEIIKF